MNRIKVNFFLNSCCMNKLNKSEPKQIYWDNKLEKKNQTEEENSGPTEFVKNVFFFFFCKHSQYWWEYWSSKKKEKEQKIRKDQRSFLQLFTISFANLTEWTFCPFLLLQHISFQLFPNSLSHLFPTFSKFIVIIIFFFFFYKLLCFHPLLPSSKHHHIWQEFP